MKNTPFYHVDVFSAEPFSGNGLTVFTESEGFSKETMQNLTREMRQFESIFLQKKSSNSVRAFVFTCEEELDFAGHPILGAAAVLHDLYRSAEEKAEWEFELNEKNVTVTTERKGNIFEAVMNQGLAQFGKVLNIDEATSILNCIGLTVEDLYPGCLPTVISTGLPYLLIPLLKNGLKSRIKVADFEERIQPFGAKFIGLLEIPTLSLRTGDNKGEVEDIATGSLAGIVGAYLVKNGFQKSNSVFRLNQGKNLGRPSQLFVEVKMKNGELEDVFVGGSIVKISQNMLSGDLAEYIGNMQETGNDQRNGYLNTLRESPIGKGSRYQDIPTFSIS
jgi:trans-2,3-dihydro-3-hydroxyanthranilate isomerase